MSVEAKTALDRSDSRMRHDDSLRGALRDFIDRVKSGDLGMLTVNNDTACAFMPKAVGADGTALEQITVPNKGPQMQAMTREGASILCYKGSNGRLRASMRHLDAKKTTEDVPVHSFDRIEKLTAGQIVALDFDLFPTGLLLYPGQHLRLTIGGWNTLGGAMPGTRNLVPDNTGRHAVRTGGDTASFLRSGTMPFAP